MSHSLGELEALCRKAARGAGLPWGAAEEAGQAVRRLAAFDLPGAEQLTVRLRELDSVDTAGITPRVHRGAWRAGGGCLCPILSGAALSDAPIDVLDRGALTMHDVIAPLLLLPFVSQVAERLQRSLELRWNVPGELRETVAVCGVASAGRVFMHVDAGGLESAPDRAVTVRVQLSTAEAGEPAVLRTRATPSDACLRALERFAQRTYAPATDASRRRGAG